MKTLYIYVLEGLADWEIVYVLQAIHMIKKPSSDHDLIDIKFIANKMEPIKTLGGFMIQPDELVDDIDNDRIAALLLPGSITWDSEEHMPVLTKVASLLERNIIVGAICGATMAIAKHGILNHYEHTSNYLEYLTMNAPTYCGSTLYQNVNSCTDRTLVTANSTSGLQWAKDILTLLDMYPNEIVDTWYQFQKTGSPESYLKFMMLSEEL